MIMMILLIRCYNTIAWCVADKVHHDGPHRWRYRPRVKNWYPRCSLPLYRNSLLSWPLLYSAHRLHMRWLALHGQKCAPQLFNTRRIHYRRVPQRVSLPTSSHLVPQPSKRLELQTHTIIIIRPWCRPWHPAFHLRPHELHSWPFKITHTVQTYLVGCPHPCHSVILLRTVTTIMLLSVPIGIT